MNCGTEKGLLQHKARNEPPCKWCIKFRDDPAPKPAPKPINHGTDAGYWREKRSGVDVCDQCAEAHREYSRIQNRKRYAKSPKRTAPKPPAPPAPCGTYAAAARHARNGEPLDDACRKARRDYQNASKKNQRGGRPAREPAPIVHGTLAGRTAHHRRGETPCLECRDAYNEAEKHRRAARKKAANQ